MATNEYDLQREVIGWQHRYPEDALGLAVQSVDRLLFIGKDNGDPIEAINERTSQILKVADCYLKWLRHNSKDKV